jgi:predicted RNase H-like HicB family nuclease
MRYVVAYEQGPNTWSAYAPDLPGCVAAADSRDAVRQLMREAIELHAFPLESET